MGGDVGVVDVFLHCRARQVRGVIDLEERCLAETVWVVNFCFRRQRVV